MLNIFKIILKILILLLVISVFLIIPIILSKTLFYFFDIQLAIAILSIYAGIIGGTLTLIGVALTINNQEKTRRKDAKEKIKPYLRLIVPEICKEIITTKKSLYDFDLYNNILKTKIEEIKIDDNNNKIMEYSDDDCFKSIHEIVIKNIENGISIIKGIEINNCVCLLKRPFIIEKNELFRLFGNEQWFNFDIFSIALIFSDLNEHWYKASFILCDEQIKIQKKTKENSLKVKVGKVYKIIEMGLPIDYNEKYIIKKI